MVTQHLLTADLAVTDLTPLRHSVALVAINLTLGCCLANTLTADWITVLDTITIHQQDLDRFFLRVQTPPHARSAPSASVASPTEFNSASRLNYGTREQIRSSIADMATSLPQMAELSAKTF